MICAEGNATAETLTAIKHLRCDHCERHKPIPRARVAKVLKEFMGQFGDAVQADCFWVRLLTGMNVQCIGIIDE